MKEINNSKFITDGNIKAKTLKKLLIKFYDNSINPITGHRCERYTDFKQGSMLSDSIYTREGVDQRLYSHDRLRVNPMIFNQHQDFFNQKTMSSGKVEELFNYLMPYKNYWGEINYRKKIVSKSEMYNESKRN